MIWVYNTRAVIAPCIVANLTQSGWNIHLRFIFSSRPYSPTQASHTHIVCPAVSSLQRQLPAEGHIQKTVKMILLKRGRSSWKGIGVCVCTCRFVSLSCSPYMSPLAHNTEPLLQDADRRRSSGWKALRGRQRISKRHTAQCRTRLIC